MSFWGSSRNCVLGGAEPLSHRSYQATKGLFEVVLGKVDDGVSFGGVREAVCDREKRDRSLQQPFQRRNVQTDSLLRVEAASQARQPI